MKFRVWNGRGPTLLVASALAMSAITWHGGRLFGQEAPAGAQTGVQTGASVKGTVLDPDAAAVPGATITLTPPKGAAITSKSGGDGSFSLESVPAGVYTVTVTMQGFGSFVRPNVRVAGQPLKINVKLSIEEQSTTITVTTNENQVSVDPDSNGSAVTIKGADLDALSDDPDELSNELSALAGPAAGPNGGQIYIDGFTGGQLPPKSAIREIRINQNPFSAQYDRAGFGRIEILTKPGTDKLHGTLSVQGMDRSFNTVTPFLQGGTQPDYHQIFFLGSVSGSINKKSSFNLSGSHRTIQDNNIFSGTIASTGPNSGTLCAPGSGTATCSPNPLPANLRATFAPRTRYDFSPRLDFALSDKNTLTVRYQFEHNDATNAGIGGLVLPSAANNQNSRENNLQMSDTQIYSARVINETRFNFERSQSGQTPVSTAPTLSVIGSFTGGGSSAGTQSNTQDHMEVQNYTSVQLQKNFIRAGMRIRSDRQALFSNTNANSTFSYRTVADYLNNSPFQYTVTSYANNRVGGRVTDVGIYAEDDWKVKPNLTFSYGIRYEAQGGISSNHDIAPRLSVNYGVPRKSGNPITVLRFGYGIFYDRFGISPVITTILQNGTNSTQQFFRASGTNTLPGCAPGSTAACGTGIASANTIYSRPNSLRSAYNSQTALGVDQQLPHRSTVSITYINTIGVHQYFSRSLPTTGTNLQYQYQSGGYLRQNQLLFNVRSQISPKFSLFGFYSLNFVKSNTNGVNSFQTDSLDARVDYGRPAFGNRSRLFLGGNYTAPFGFVFNPFMIANSGTPYNITTGVDTNADSVINDRAAFASGANGNISCTNPSNFSSPTPALGLEYTRIPAGYCTGPAEFTFNTRVVRAFGFGSKTGANANNSGDQGGQGGQRDGGGRGPGGGGGGGPRGGGGFGGFGGGGSSSGHKYTVSLGAQIQNLFNNVNYAPQNGNLSAVPSGLFGRSQSLQGGPFSSGSAVRRIFLQANFSF